MAPGKPVDGGGTVSSNTFYTLFQGGHPFFSPSLLVSSEISHLPLYLKPDTTPNAALIIDGDVMQKTMIGIKRPKGGYLSMKKIVENMEKVYGMIFTRRNWYQGTKDGKWNSVSLYIIS